MVCLKPDSSRLVIFVRELDLPAHVGLYDHEHGHTQPLIFDVEVTLNGAGDEGISSTVDYDKIVRIVQDVLAKGHHLLLETIAKRVCAELFEDHRVKQINVRITKPSALKLARSAGIVWSESR
ncbi:dihydroneopterin aldolase [Bradyrhizobium canariense]|uniref:dihydroneopterin aldolase n=1 Tax=Bradyrhizobium canariense TaxID=255045 RepID=A0A1H1NFS3_9BRAD|nr:dihydroneopterin aldolase [Bradyrhizobium canariense]